MSRRNILNVPRNNQYLVFASNFKQHSNHPQVQGGEGFMEIVRNLYHKGKDVVGKISDAYTGELGTAIRNAIPSANAQNALTARPGFAGEKHAILQLSENPTTYGVANYMGPSTQIEKQLRRNDPPRSETDKASMAHDIRYMLSKNKDDIRKADDIMMRKVAQIDK